MFSSWTVLVLVRAGPSDPATGTGSGEARSNWVQTMIRTSELVITVRYISDAESMRRWSFIFYANIEVVFDGILRGMKNAMSIRFKDKFGPLQDNMHCKTIPKYVG